MSDNYISEYMQAWVDHEAAALQTIALKPIYIDINKGNIHAALIFSQIMYWFAPSKKGASRVSVARDGYRWLARAYSDWYVECRVNEHTARKVIKEMKDAGLIHTGVWKFAGTPVLHIRPNWPKIEAAIKKQIGIESNPPDTTYQVDPLPNNESYTETTTETTKDIAPRSGAQPTDLQEPVCQTHANGAPACGDVEYPDFAIDAVTPPVVCPTCGKQQARLRDDLSVGFTACLCTTPEEIALAGFDASVSAALRQYYTPPLAAPAAPAPAIVMGKNNPVLRTATGSTIITPLNRKSQYQTVTAAIEYHGATMMDKTAPTAQQQSVTAPAPTPTPTPLPLPEEPPFREAQWLMLAQAFLHERGHFPRVRPYLELGDRLVERGYFAVKVTVFKLTEAGRAKMSECPAYLMARAYLAHDLKQQRKTNRREAQKAVGKKTMPANAQPYMDELCRAFGVAETGLTESEYSLYRGVAMELERAQKSTDDIQTVYDYCKAQEWQTAFTPKSLTKHWSAALVARTRQQDKKRGMGFITFSEDLDFG